MPSSRETVVNRALSGDELKKIILADSQRLVDNEGMLSPHCAFGRVGYTLTLRLHMDNAFASVSEITVASRPASIQQIEANPALAALDSVPLKGASELAEVGALELTRQITSPNAERLREGMPVPVQVKQQDGTIATEQISYPADAFPELGPGDVHIEDKTHEAAAAWGINEQVIAVPE
jgi:hypothetical protein